MNASPDIQKKAAELAATLARKARLPVFIAAASLSINRLVQDELQTWYAWIPQLLKVDGFMVSLAGNLSRLTWHAAAPEPEMTQALRAYLVEYPIPDESFVDLDRALARFKPDQLGAWITARKESFEVGWYLRPDGDRFESLRPFLPQSPDLNRVLDWSREHNADRCVRFGRSMVSTEKMVELYFQINSSAGHTALENGLLLYRHLGLPFPADPVLAALTGFDQPDIVASIQLGKGGAAKVGLMLPNPSTELVLRVYDALGGLDAQALALFEGCLQTTVPAYLEYEQVASGDSVQMHYEV